MKVYISVSRYYWNKFLLFILLMLMAGCGTQQNLKGEYPENYKELETLVETGEYEIENQWALPLNGSMIDLIGNTNYLRFKSDSVDVYLPYFGVRHSGGDYGGRDGGIKYKGSVEDLVVEKDPEKERISIEFKASKENETFDFGITLFANGNTNTSVNSSSRNSISYRGKVRSFPRKNKE